MNPLWRRIVGIILCNLVVLQGLTILLADLPSSLAHIIRTTMRQILHLIKVPRRFTWRSTQLTNSSALRPSRITLFMTRIRWFHVPLTFAATFVALGQLRKYRIKNIQHRADNASENDHLEVVYKASHLEVSMYKMLPLRTLSRFWGWINSIELPASMRTPILKSYANAFGCNLAEADIDDLRQYKNLGEFFRRSLKPGVRPIQGNDEDIVSPSDGTILHLGSAKDGLLEQVKGITYTIESFLGPNTWQDKERAAVASKEADAGDDYQQSLLHHRNPSSAGNATDLYYCIIYLAPGDYHRFHSPANWTVNYRRHFPGKLYSVRPNFVSWFPNVFAVNERVAYLGSWKHGFFSMAPVGATNVGSMRIYFDDELKTNRTQMSLKTNYEDKCLGNVSLKKGDPFGEFNLGSTIVLIFEAPKDMQFNVSQGTKIKYGELISLLERQCDNK